jgi:hypothetical protein
MNEECGCIKCVDARQTEALALGNPDAWARMVITMSLCPVCGNKRCPKASNHEFECTGSNEPGQEGSVYR